MANAKPEEQSKGEVVHIQPSRLTYHPALQDMGVDKTMWRVLCESIFPNAQTIEGIALAVRYCNARKLDIMKRPVNIIPMYNKQLKRNVETVWASIAEFRITAARTGEYAGCDVTECGPVIEETFSAPIDEWVNGVKTEVQKSITIKYHEWMSIRLYRIIKGVRCPFAGPKVYFKEIYSRIKYGVDLPNPQWQKAPNGMLQKCCEAAALRMTFPEEFGSEYTSEEQEGKVIEVTQETVLPPMTKEQVAAVAEEHLQQVGAEPEPEAEETPEPIGEQDSDWLSKYEAEIEPGLNACKSHADLMLFLNENTDLIKSMPLNIRDRMDKAVGKKTDSFKAKK